MDLVTTLIQIISLVTRWNLYVQRLQRIVPLEHESQKFKFYSHWDLAHLSLRSILGIGGIIETDTRLNIIFGLLNMYRSKFKAWKQWFGISSWKACFISLVLVKLSSPWPCRVAADCDICLIFHSSGIFYCVTEDHEGLQLFNRRGDWGLV